MFPSFTVFGAAVHPYSLLMLAGAIACVAVYSVLSFRRHGDYRENIFALEMLFIATAAALPAAIFFDALFKLPERGALVFRGATFYGGVLSAIGVWCLLLLCKRRRQVSLYERLADLAPGIALGHFFGRIGCFLGGCCYGAPTESVFGVVFPEGSPPALQFGATPVHPTQLYEAAALFVIFFILLGWGRKNAFPLYAILYGSARFVLEFFRADDRGTLFGLALSPAQILSLALILLGEILWLVRIVKEAKRLGTLKKRPA